MNGLRPTPVEGSSRAGHLHPLDNAVWHALRGPHAARAVAAGAAARYGDDLTPFAAVDDAGSPGAWSDLASLIAPAGGVLFRERVVVPIGWTEVWRGAGLQLVATGRVDGPGWRGPAAEVVDLGDADAEEMAALVARTEPGPWRARTHTLGPYVGIRAGGRLVAMGGTRLQTEQHWEISAVCTDPDRRGGGLGRAVVTALAARIAAAGLVPFLHVASTNTGALRLYQSLGFEVRGPVDFVLVRPPGSQART